MSPFVAVPAERSSRVGNHALLSTRRSHWMPAQAAAHRHNSSWLHPLSLSLFRAARRDTQGEGQRLVDLARRRRNAEERCAWRRSWRERGLVNETCPVVKRGPPFAVAFDEVNRGPSLGLIPTMAWAFVTAVWAINLSRIAQLGLWEPATEADVSCSRFFRVQVALFRCRCLVSCRETLLAKWDSRGRFEPGRLLALICLPSLKCYWRSSNKFC